MAYPLDLRLRVVQAVREQGLGQAEAAKVFQVSVGSVNAWLQKHKQGNLGAAKPGPTGSRTLDPEHLEDLRRWVQERPGITSREAAAKLGGKVSDGYVRFLWRRMGLSFKKKT